MQKSGTRTFVREVQLGEVDSRMVGELVGQLLELRREVSLNDWLRAATEAGPHLPLDLQRALWDFKEGKGKPALLIHGFNASDEELGPTPSHWRGCRPLDPDSPTMRQETGLMLLGQFLGDVFGYASLQEGRLIHNLLPIAGAESDQSGHGSSATLEWHTEDAFTPFRADFLALLGLRNSEHVATTVCGVEVLESLGATDETLLKEARFRVVPDEEHLRHPPKGEDPSILMDMAKGDGQISVLREGRVGLEMVIDSVYMHPVGVKAAAAFRRAEKLISGSLERVSVGAGDALILDNRRVVHGREKFRATFDGTDRWLLKASITETLQDSVAYRLSETDRVLQ